MSKGLKKFTALATSSIIALSTVPAMATGTYTPASYNPGMNPDERGSQITVRYVDDKGNKMVDLSGRPADEVINVNIGQSYQTTQKDFYGYTFKAVTGQASGVANTDKIEVVYTYTINKRTVTTEYKHVNGMKTLLENNDPNKPIAPKTQTLDVFSAYTTEQPTAAQLYGYTLHEIPYNATGVIQKDEDVLVTYVYATKMSSLTVKYVDEQGNNLKSPVTTIKAVFEDYTTSAPIIYGYDLKTTPSNSTGRIEEQPAVVTYVYKRRPATVIVTYKDTDGNELKTSKNYNGLVNDPYDIDTPAITGYTLIQKPQNAVGIYTENPIKVDLVYMINRASVLVNYLDENNVSISEPVIIEGNYNDNYTTEAKDIYGYELIKTPTNHAGRLPTGVNGPTIVNYVYKKKSAKVTVDFVNESGVKIYESQIINGKVFDKYTTEPEVIYGWELVTSSNNTKGSMTEEDILVTYTYKQKIGKVTARYVDQDTGLEIEEPVVQTGYVNDQYKTDKKDIYGYTQQGTPKTEKGYFTEDDIVVTYLYKLNAKTLTVNYLDENGRRIAPATTQNLKVGETYTFSPITIQGYRPISIPMNAKGKQTDKSITINFIYRAQDSTIKVSYIDTNGNEIAPSVTLQGKYNDEYETTKATIPGYILVEMPQNANGFYALDEQNVIYQYQAEPSVIHVKFVDEDGNLLDPTIEQWGDFDEDGFTGQDYVAGMGEYYLNGVAGEQYHTIWPKYISGYKLLSIPENWKGVHPGGETTITFVYSKSEGNVTARFVDLNGNIISDDVYYTGRAGDTYTVFSKDIPGYTLVDSPDKQFGVFEKWDEPLMLTYVYSANSASVLVHYVDENGNYLANSIQKDGYFNEEYTTEPIEIPGYVISQLPENAVGKYDLEPVEVTYVYAAKKGVAIVDYTDLAGNKIAESKILTGDIGTSFEPEAITIDGYMLDDITNNTHDSTFKEEDTIITFKYKKVDGGGNVTTPDTPSENPSDNPSNNPSDTPSDNPSDTPSSNPSENPSDTPSDNPSDKPTSNGKVYISYVDANGNPLADTVTVEIAEDGTYEEHKLDINGYELYETLTSTSQGNKRVIYKYKPATVTPSETPSETPSDTPSDVPSDTPSNTPSQGQTIIISSGGNTTNNPSSGGITINSGSTNNNQNSGTSGNNGFTINSSGTTNNNSNNNGSLQINTTNNGTSYNPNKDYGGGVKTDDSVGGILTAMLSGIAALTAGLFIKKKKR